MRNAFFLFSPNLAFDSWQLLCSHQIPLPSSCPCQILEPEPKFYSGVVSHKMHLVDSSNSLKRRHCENVYGRSDEQRSRLATRNRHNPPTRAVLRQAAPLTVKLCHTETVNWGIKAAVFFLFLAFTTLTLQPGWIVIVRFAREWYEAISHSHAAVMNYNTTIASWFKIETYTL